jgi:triosephosphate isomerase
MIRKKIMAANWKMNLTHQEAQSYADALFAEIGVETAVFIRSVMASLSDRPTADQVRIQYGGSVKPQNAQELLCQHDIDGALVGGASLDARTFALIARMAKAV